MFFLLLYQHYTKYHTIIRIALHGQSPDIAAVGSISDFNSTAATAAVHLLRRYVRCNSFFLTVKYSTLPSAKRCSNNSTHNRISSSK